MGLGSGPVWSQESGLNLKSDGLKGQARPVHMSTSNLSHALTLVLSNHLESVTKQKHQHLSRLPIIPPPPTGYIMYVCISDTVFLFFIFLPFLYWANGKW